MRRVWECRQCWQFSRGVSGRINLFASPYGTVWYEKTHYLTLSIIYTDYKKQKTVLQQ